MHLGGDEAQGVEDPHCAARTTMPITAQTATKPAVAKVMRLCSRDTASRSSSKSIDIFARHSDATYIISDAYCAYVFMSVAEDTWPIELRTC